MLWWTLRQLQAKDPKVRRRAAEKLGTSGEPRAVEPLITALRDTNRDVQEAATQALAHIGPAVLEPLLRDLKDEKLDVPKAAAVLGQIKDARIVEKLAVAVSDANRDVRKAVAQALGQIRDTHAVEPLIDALTDEDAGVREAAAQALGQIRDAHAVEPLIVALQDRYQRVLEAVVAALGWIGDVRAVEPLGAILTAPSKGRELREVAAQALQRIGGTPALDPLLGALTDRDFAIRWAARQALDHIDRDWAKSDAARQAIPGLVAALNDWRNSDCKAAAEVLVVRPSYSASFSTGYSFLSLMRASAVVNRQSTVAPLALRRASQAAVSWISVG
jgi:HEAT repeat protein